MSDPALIYGFQPVAEAVAAGRSIDAIYLHRDASAKTRRLVADARRAGIEVVEVSKAKLAERVGGAAHQGIVATLADGLTAAPASTVEAILERAEAAGAPPFVLLLDQVQDPRNLGALVRTAHAFGVHGVVIPKDRSASMTPTAIKASAGAAAHLPVATVTNLKRAIRTLQAANVWVAAASLDGDALDAVRLDGAIGLVLGAEGKGVRRTVAAACDMHVRIDLPSGFESLNVSVAGGILMHEVARTRARRRLETKG